MLPTIEFPCLYKLDLDLYIVPYAHLEMEFLQLLASNHLISLIGPVVKVSALTVDVKDFKSHLHWDFSGWSHTSDLKLALQ